MKSKRRIFICCIMSLMLALVMAMPMSVSAASNVTVTTGTELADEIDAATGTDTTTIVLGNDIELEQGITVEGSKKIILDLNGHKLSAPNRVLSIESGYFEVVGPGSIVETEPNYAPIVIKGSKNLADMGYTTVKVGEGVYLEGWAGVFLTPYKSSEAPYAYGVTVDLDCVINAVKDTSEADGHGVYINGQIKNTESNYPVFNLHGNTKITSTGTGIYAAGYAEWNIDGASIEGDIGIGAKSGKFDIKDAAINGTGEYVDPIGYNGNGINTDGSALLIDSNHAGYAGKIDITISGDTVLNSKNSKAVSEFVTYNSSDPEAEAQKDTNIISFVINGGTFNGAEGKPAVQLSDEVKEKNAAKITAGKFSAEPDSALVKSDMTAELARNGETTYLIGQSTVNAALAEAQKGDELTVKTAAEDAELVDVPEGVIVKNNADAAIKVNDEVLAADQTVTVVVPDDEEEDKTDTDQPAGDDQKDPATGDDNKGDTDAGKDPVKEPTEVTPEKTGDANDIVLWLALMVLTAAALAGTAAYSRKRG